MKIVKMEFCTDMAKEFGINEAIIYRNIQYWIIKNEKAKKHFYDGQFWTYNSKKSYTEIFTWLSESQIKRCLNKLIKFDFINVGNYNINRFNQSLWYSDNHHWTESSNGSDGIAHSERTESSNGSDGIAHSERTESSNLTNDKPYNKLTDNKPDILKEKKNISKTEKSIIPLKKKVIEKFPNHAINEIEFMKNEYFTFHNDFTNGGEYFYSIFEIESLTRIGREILSYLAQKKNLTPREISLEDFKSEFITFLNKVHKVSWISNPSPSFIFRKFSEIINHKQKPKNTTKNTELNTQEITYG